MLASMFRDYKHATIQSLIPHTEYAKISIANVAISTMFIDCRESDFGSVQTDFAAGESVTCVTDNNIIANSEFSRG